MMGEGGKLVATGLLCSEDCILRRLRRSHRCSGGSSGSGFDIMLGWLKGMGYI
mgnify:CR=1 FL=1